MTIPKLNLDPQNTKEMLVQMYQRTRAASNNALTDFTPSSPIAAIHEGQAYAVAELLYFLNKLPEATALEVLRLVGVSRNPGTYSRGTLTFTLQYALTSPYSLPTGFSIPDQRGVSWVLEEDLYIAPNALRGVVRVRSGLPGSAFNRQPYQVNIQNPQLAYVLAIQNLDPLKDGSDLETIPDLLARAQVAMRSRGTLVSASDYEIRSQELLGTGSKATCIPLLGANKITEKEGHVHIFLQDSLGLQPSPATCQEIQTSLRADSYAASSVWVSPVDLLMVSLDVTVDVPVLDKGLTAKLYKTIEVYLSPQKYKLGSALLTKELEYLIRSQAGIKGVTSVLINGSAVNLAMPVRYCQPWLGHLKLYQSDTNGRFLVEQLATGYADPD